MIHLGKAENKFENKQHRHYSYASSTQAFTHLLPFTCSHIEFVKASIGPFWQQLLMVFEGDNWPFGHHTYRTCIVSSIKAVVKHYSEKYQKRYLLQYTVC